MAEEIAAEDIVVGSQAKTTMPRGRVAIARCDSYDPELVERQLRECLEPLGGMSAFVQPGQRVLLKPNLLAIAAPSAAITTHPAVVAAVGRLVVEAGGRPYLADTPSANLSTSAAGLRRLYQASGLLEIAEAAGIELCYDVSAEMVANPEAKLARRLELIKPALEADVIIALPKLKTHVLTTLSGATKILFGTVPGLQKPRYHASFAEPEHFADLLLDIIVRLKPALFIMDGVLAMEGDGPGTHGRPRQVGALLAGADAVAVDLAACQIVGIDPEIVPPLRAAKARAWQPDAASLEIVGVAPASFGMTDFALPNNVNSQLGTRSMVALPTSVRSWISGLLSPRPYPLATKCTACGNCVRACPNDAISLRPTAGAHSTNGKLAVVDNSRCILCYCCHEVCPDHAIALRHSLASWGLRKLAASSG